MEPTSATSAELHQISQTEGTPAQIGSTAMFIHENLLSEAT